MLKSDRSVAFAQFSFQFLHLSLELFHVFPKLLHGLAEFRTIRQVAKLTKILQISELPQFLDLVEFYVLKAPRADGAKAEEDLRAQGVAAVTRVLALPAYHVTAAQELIARMQPGARRRR